LRSITGSTYATRRFATASAFLIFPLNDPVRLLRAPYTVVNDRERSQYDRFFLRISPYTTRRYTIVIRSHVNRRISPYTVVYNRAYLIWRDTSRSMSPMLSGAGAGVGI
jgi:hypothetical protein